MKQLLLSVAISFALASQGQSKVSTKQKKIKSLFALMHQDSLIIKTLDATTASMVKAMTAIYNDTAYTNHGVDATPLIQKLMEKRVKISKQTALKFLDVDMVDIYDKYFSIEEVEDFISFYKSKSGQKMLTQMPGITKDIMGIMTTKYQADFQQSLFADIQEMTNEIEEQIKTN